MNTQQIKLLVLLLAFGMFGLINTEFNVIGILPLIAERFGVSIERAGILVSAYAIVTASFALFIPLLFANINKKLVLLLCMGLFALSNIGATLSTDFDSLLIYRIIPSIVHPLYISFSLLIASSLVEKKDCARMVSWVLMGISAGIVFGVPISNMLGNYVSYEVVMGIGALFNTLAFFGILVYMPKDIKTSEQKVSISSQLSYLKAPLVWLGLMICLFTQASSASVWSYIAEYLKSVTQVSYLFSGILLLGASITTLFGNYIAGKMLAKDSRQLLVLHSVLFIALYSLIFFFGATLAIMFVLSLSLGVMIGISLSIQQYVIASAMPNAGEFANGLFCCLSNVGIAVGTSFGGFVIAHYGIEYIALGGMALLLLNLCFVGLKIRLCVKTQRLGVVA